MFNIELFGYPSCTTRSRWIQSQYSKGLRHDEVLLGTFSNKEVDCEGECVLKASFLKCTFSPVYPNECNIYRWMMILLWLPTISSGLFKKLIRGAMTLLGFVGSFLLQVCIQQLLMFISILPYIYFVLHSDICKLKACTCVVEVAMPFHGGQWGRTWCLTASNTPLCMLSCALSNLRPYLAFCYQLYPILQTCPDGDLEDVAIARCLMRVNITVRITHPTQLMTNMLPILFNILSSTTVDKTKRESLILDLCQ